MTRFAGRPATFKWLLFFSVWSLFWVVCSDFIMQVFVASAPPVLWRVELLEGLIYVVVTVLITGLLVKQLQRENRRIRAANESKLRSIENAGLIGVFTWRKSVVTYANEAFLSMLGYTDDEVASGKLKTSELPAPEYRFIEDQALLELAERGRTRIYQQELLTKNGSRVFVMGGRALIAGDPDQGIGYALDITPVITAERREQQLAEQLQSAHRLNALGQIAGGIAHDFNNLLGVIVGYTALMQADAGDNQMRNEAAEVLKAAEKAKALIRKLLAFSQKEPSHPELLDVNEIVSDFQKMLRCVIGDMIEMKLLLGEEVGCVVADSTQLEQVIMNLVVNARDAMPGGGVITIATEKTRLDGPTDRLKDALAGEYVMIRVADTGGGIPEHVRDRIFEPFFSTKKGAGGTGLGLSIVDGIVRQIGGYIYFDSQVGQGTEFTVVLPWAAPHTNTAVSVKGAEIHGGGETILLIEDAEELRGMLTTVLTSLGYTVLPARDGQHGVEVAHQYRRSIQLVLTDVAMPHMSGPEAVRQIRRERPDVKALFLTGFADPRLLHGRPLENALIMEKPVTPDVLASKIREVLAKKAA
jgi:two-component system, cell cycle sensor histidine kinase and response regulator CckA